MDSDDTTAEPAANPLVTVLVPARNEAADIGRCLAAIVAQDLDHGLIEVVVATADSSDDTAVIAKEVLDGAGFQRVEILSCGPGSTPVNLNTGLGVAAGRYLCRVDARSIIPPDYVRRCVDLLQARPDVAVTGGAQRAVARDHSANAIGIARALNNRWGMGLSKYRSGAASGPTDTVYLGAFRTDELRDAGGWDERFATNQDFELNRRMGRRGIVWFESGLDVEYLPRRTVGELFAQYRRFGQWKVRYWRLTGDRPRPRQLLLLATGPLALSGLGAAALSARRRPLATAAAVLAGGVAGALIESTGADRPRGGPLAHGVAVLSSASIAGGWSIGAWRGIVGSFGADREQGSGR